MLFARDLPGQNLPQPPNPLFAALLVSAASIPAAAGLAALITWLARRRSRI
jgi:hypothetical protein